MAIDYKLMRATGGLPKNAELKVITVERQTASLRRMSKSIEQATSLTTGDILATIIALKSEMVAELKMGNRVHIPGIGYFSLALKGDITETLDRTDHDCAMQLYVKLSSALTLNFCVILVGLR